MPNNQTRTETGAEKLAELRRRARLIRWLIVDTVYQAKDGHPGPALSIADLVAALYFHAMDVDPANPRRRDRDRLVLSKGHGCAAIYAALAMRGFFGREELRTFRSCGSILQGHPCMRKTPGVDMTSGSLGNGLAIGLGMDLARMYRGGRHYTYVVAGDGEMQEGSMWEALRCAGKYAADHLILVVDINGWQASGNCGDVGGRYRLDGRFADFGWSERHIDGHDMAQVMAVLDEARRGDGRPWAILADTVKGKGVSCFENNNKFHKGVPSESEWRTARAELGVDDHEL